MFSLTQRARPPVKVRPVRPASLVVIEYSATWPRWLAPTQNGDMAVVAQHYEGAPRSLLVQVASRMTRLEAQGWAIGRVILVTNGRLDPDSLAARSILARGLLSKLQQKSRGEFILTLEERAGKRAASQLRHLAQSLEQSVRGLPLSLSTRIGEAVWASTHWAPLEEASTLDQDLCAPAQGA